MYEVYKMNLLRNRLAVLMCFFLCIQIILAQNESKSKWVTGKGSAQGTNFAEMRLAALNSARADALKQLGIVIVATDIALKSEFGHTLTDFYTKFAESSTKGLILEERNVKVSHPIPLENQGDVLSGAYKVDVSLEALVAIQTGEPDPGFDVKLEANRHSYVENEPVHLTITSTRSGYLTLFAIENDSLTLIFPNSLNPDNFINANVSFDFPPKGVYKLTLQTKPGQKKSVVTFVATVSKDDIPFSIIEEAKYQGKHLKLKQALLTHYARWLYKIPIDKRSSDYKAVEVIYENIDKN